jgi:hypothetical protein
MASWKRRRRVQLDSELLSVAIVLWVEKMVFVLVQIGLRRGSLGFHRLFDASHLHAIIACQADDLHLLACP